MTKKELLINEIDHIPENLIDEIIDFVQFLKVKKMKINLETTILSESSLSKDWLSKEEEEAWQYL
ncbi:MAG: DUF2281 domain-containing protein [Candidatus Sericytochromatia bacterium]|nr:DUF2281 domain-containing protein [Candidatus Sericytochromatia bacterium]